MIDIEADSPDNQQGATLPVSDGVLKSISALASTLVMKQKQLAMLEEAAKELKLEIFELETKTLPDAMTSAQTRQFALTAEAGGGSITVEPFIQGSLPSKDPVKRDEALRWLHENGHDGIIKRALAVNLAKGQYEQGDEIKKAITEALEKLKLKKVVVEDQEDVHHMTLKSWAREMQENAEEFPAETLGLFIGQRAKVVLPKN